MLSKDACWFWRVRQPWWAIATQTLTHFFWNPDCHPSYYLRTLADGSLNICLFMQNYLGPRWPMGILSNHVFQIVYILLQFKTLLHFPDGHRDNNREVAIKTYLQRVTWKLYLSTLVIGNTSVLLWGQTQTNKQTDKRKNTQTNDRPRKSLKLLRAT